MKMKKIIACVACLACLEMAGPLLAGQTDQKASDSSSKPMKHQMMMMHGKSMTMEHQTGSKSPTRFNKVSHLIGMTVMNESGERLGDIKDVVIDYDNGTVSYLVMSSGGVLGIGEKLLAAPLDAFTLNREKGCLELNATKDNIARAEGLGDHWPSVTEPSFAATPFWKKPAPAATHADESHEKTGKTEKESY